MKTEEEVREILDKIELENDNIIIKFQSGIEIDENEKIRMSKQLEENLKDIRIFKWVLGEKWKS